MSPVQPPIAPELALFWAAAARGELLLPRCERCGLLFWYPRPYCPDCASLDIRWVPASGLGRVYSFTVDRRRGRAAESGAPRVLAYVELDEGPRVVSEIIQAGPDAIGIGQRVQAVYERIDETAGLLRFRPAESSASPGATGAFQERD